MSWAEFLTLAPGSDRIPVELFQILKDDAVESAALNMQYALYMQYAGSRQRTNKAQRQQKEEESKGLPEHLLREVFSNRLQQLLALEATIKNHS